MLSRSLQIYVNFFLNFHFINLDNEPIILIGFPLSTTFLKNTQYTIQ